jgi:hypothetical protein
MCPVKKENIPSVQVKNKPHVGGLEHAFILVSMDSTVANSKQQITNASALLMLTFIIFIILLLLG